MKAKRPTLKQKVAVYEGLLNDLDFHRSVTMDNDKIVALLEKISAWSYAHRSGNGENDDTRDARIDSHFWKFDVYGRVPR